MKIKIKQAGSLLLWGGICLCFLLGLLFGSMAGHGFLSLVCYCLSALLLVYKALELLTRKRAWAKTARRILNIFVCIGLAIVIPTGIVIATVARGDDHMPCDYLVVLGAGVHGTTPSLSLRSRLEAAQVYLRDHPEITCIVSGGQGEGEDISEAKCMFDYLVAAGIDPGRIRMEDRSTSTEENLRFSLELIQAETGSRPDSIGLLSNEYHLLRGKLFAQKVGVTAYGVPAKTPYFTLFLNYYLREIAGVWHEILIGG